MSRATQSQLPAVPVRERLRISGAVQGVGFRPFVYRLAHELGIGGWVLNGPAGVVIELEGSRAGIDDFQRRLYRELPPVARIDRLEREALPAQGERHFVIHNSDRTGEKRAAVLPDLAVCAACLAELRDPADRRYRYPFINCTHCGPRWTIIEALPYDRPRTTMREFAMCPACRAEYEDPLDRRFHAQPVACPVCGPQLELWDGDGAGMAGPDTAMEAAAERIRAGAIVAVKGLGGFHLICDARCERAVGRLRRRKRRPHKPLAVMYRSLEAVEGASVIDAATRELLSSPAAPIVLTPRRADCGVAAAVAPDTDRLGAMLPYTPLHELLLEALGFEVVATSGNLTDEPICIDEHDALTRLRGIADAFLVHDRPIARPVDDSVAQIALGKPMLLRRARGYAPMTAQLGCDGPPALAVGGQLKSTVALAHGVDATVGPHIGDLATLQAQRAFEEAVTSLQGLYDAAPAVIARDSHPDYFTSRWADARGERCIEVQHHHAHIVAAMIEHALDGPVQGVAWDGTGYGPDGTVWGGEILLAGRGRFERVGHLRAFQLPGGERAVREPWRCALGVLMSLGGREVVARYRSNPALAALDDDDLELLMAATERGLNAPVTTSAGRLFDALAALAGLGREVSYEAQAAIRLEQAADERIVESWPAALGRANGMDVLDWGPLVAAFLEGLDAGTPLATLAAVCHNTLASLVAAAIEPRIDVPVVLTGGCFQNRLLLERCYERISAGGGRVYWPQSVPPNDGGLALGQLEVARRQG